ncbi:MAG: FHIPEP family type III secretion protein [Candidatus Solibacter sp.]|jgi:tetratricopeptide (TPR) repeat protein
MATSEQALGARAQSLRDLWFRQGMLLAGRGRNAEVVDALEHALGGLGHEPAPLRIMAELAGAYAAAGKKEDAFRTYLQASNADPEHAFELIGKAARLVDPELANTVWSWMSDAWLPPWTAPPRKGAAQVARLLLAACACSARARYADALAYVHQAEEACGKDCALASAILAELDKISDALSRAGELDLATRALEAEVRLDPTSMRNRWNLVDVLRRKSWTAEPPGVIRSDIEAGARAWEEAVAIRPPDAGDSWAWLTRVAVNGQLARLPDADRWQLAWEAVCHCETALIFVPDDLTRWNSLANWHRFLCLIACEDQATGEALKQPEAEEDATALEQRISFLVNTDRLDEIEPLIDMRRKLGEVPWLTAIDAFVRLARGEMEEAARIARAIIPKVPDLPWCTDVLAAAYMRGRRHADAMRYYQQILDGWKPDDLDGQLRASNAAFNLGAREAAVDRAIEIARDYVERHALPTEGSVRLDLGIFYLVKGRMELGEPLVGEAVRLLRGPREMNEYLRWDIPQLERYSRKWPHGAKFREVLNATPHGIKAILQARVAELAAHRPTAEEELLEIAGRFGGGDASGWLSIAVEAALARIESAGQPQLAAQRHRRLLEREPRRFPAAAVALERLARNHVDEGDRLAQENSAPAALAAYARAREIAPAGTLAADAGAGQAYVRLSLPDRAAAAGAMESAVELYRRGGAADAEGLVAARVAGLVPDIDTLWRVEEVAASLAASGDGAVSRVAAEVTARIPERLDGWLGLSESAGADRSPWCQPIVLELGSGLVPEDTSENWPLFHSYFPEMRQRISGKSGVTVPGIYVQASTTLAANRYSIALRGSAQPFLGGPVPLDRRYHPGPPDSLRALGIADTGLAIEPLPGTGAEGCWVAQSHWEAVTAAKGELWEPLVFVTRVLEAVLARRLDDFVGLDQAWEIVKGWSQKTRSWALIDKSAGLPERLHLARLLRTLVRQGISLLHADEIMGALPGVPLNSVSLPAPVRTVRPGLRPWLPGNSPHATRIFLSEERESAAMAWAGDATARFCPAPEALEDMIGYIRSELAAVPRQGADTEIALVARNPELAAFLRCVVRAEFPGVFVLAQEELVS